MEQKIIRMLLVEDEPPVARSVARLVVEASEGRFRITQVERLAEALQRLVTDPFDVLLLDLSLPDSSGLLTLMRVHAQARSLPIVILTGLDDQSTALDAVREGAQDYVLKGQLDGRMLVRTLHYAIERKRLERETLEVSEREQQRIGQDLHDGPCQHMMGVVFMLDALRQKLVARSPADASQVDEIARLLNEGITQMRDVARTLYPVDLHGGGLIPALRQLGETTEKLLQVKCQLNHDRAVRISDPVVSHQLYRITQEAISNAVRHGQATHISVALEADGDKITLQIKDDGSGFRRSAGRNRGMGLNIMTYRAQIIGATLDIRPAADRGTTVTCLFRKSHSLKSEKKS